MLALLLLLCLTCTKRETPAASALQPVDDTKPVDGGTLLRRLDVDIITLNPIVATSRYDRFIDNYLFTPLIYLDKDLQAIPGLAKSWDISDDGRVYTFELNEKATFSDGTPVRASDVVFTLGKIVDPKAEAVQIAGGFDLLDMAHTRAVDDSTVEVHFREPLASQLMHFNDVLVLPEHVYAKGDFRNDHAFTPVGSGPYKFVRHDAGKEVVVQRRSDYWAERPHIETVVFKVISDHSVGFNALRRGEIDESVITSDTWLRERSNPEITKKIDFKRFYTLNYNYIAWNTRNPLLADKRVRRAMAMCVPTESIIQDLYHGTARAMSGPFTPDEWAYNPTVPVIRFDPQEAKRMLASMGWLDRNGDGVLEKDGRPFEFDLMIMSGSTTAKQVAQMVQAEMKKIGVTMNVVMLEGSMAIQRLLAGNFEAAYLGMDLDADPDPYAIFHSSQAPPRGQNFSFYSNPQADALIERARREMNLSKRKELYAQIHQLLADDQPFTWIVQVSAKWGFNRRVRGVETSRGLGLYLWYPGELAWWIVEPPRSGARP